jgi:CHC2-type zinc finger protein
MNKILTHLERVKQTGSGRWIACCPSHQDKSPSLAIRDDNGKILLRCFAGCSVFEIVSAIGMNLSDLFPESGEYSKLVTNPFPAVDVLRCIQSEATYVAITAARMAQGGTLTQSDKGRLMKAAGRIGAAYE